MRKLKSSEIKPFREEMLRKQDGYCNLCNTKIEGTEAALDHDHKTGYIRGVLHRDCNALLGKIENYIAGYGKRLRLNPGILEEALENMVPYMQDNYRMNPLHPTHRTKDDKAIRTLKRRLKKAKLSSTKEKIKKQIQLLKGG